MWKVLGKELSESRISESTCASDSESEGRWKRMSLE